MGKEVVCRHGNLGRPGRSTVGAFLCRPLAASPPQTIPKVGIGATQLIFANSGSVEAHGDCAGRRCSRAGKPPVAHSCVEVCRLADRSSALTDGPSAGGDHSERSDRHEFAGSQEGWRGVFGGRNRWGRGVLLNREGQRRPEERDMKTTTRKRGRSAAHGPR